MINSYASSNITAIQGSQPHNIWTLNDPDEYFICDSANGNVISNKGKQITLGSFPRGVVITNDTHYIGTSDIAERAERDQLNSKIVYFNTDWQATKTITITGQYQLLDIKHLG